MMIQSFTNFNFPSAINQHSNWNDDSGLSRPLIVRLHGHGAIKMLEGVHVACKKTSADQNHGIDHLSGNVKNRSGWK